MPSALRSRITPEDLADQLGVERARDLVEQQRPRVRRERAHDRHALLLAARQAVRALVLAPARPNRASSSRAALARLLARRAVRAHRPEHDVLENRHMGEQVEGLEHHPEPAADRDRVDARVGDHLAVEQDVAVVDLLEQIDAAQQRRLARAGGADQRDGLVLVHLQVDPAQHLGVAVGLRDAADLEHGGHGCGSCIRSTIAGERHGHAQVEEGGRQQRRVVEVRRRVDLRHPERLERRRGSTPARRPSAARRSRSAAAGRRGGPPAAGSRGAAPASR